MSAVSFASRLIRFFCVLVCASCVVGKEDLPADDPGEPGDCARRIGTYRWSYEERSGDCEELPSLTVTYRSQPTQAEAPCTGSYDYASDNCSVDITTRCPEPSLGSGFNSRITSELDWDEDGKEGTGSARVTIYDGSGRIFCESDYDVTVRKQ